MRLRVLVFLAFLVAVFEKPSSAAKYRDPLNPVKELQNPTRIPARTKLKKVPRLCWIGRGGSPTSAH